MTTMQRRTGSPRRPRARLALPAILVAGVVLTGCGDDGGDATGTTSANTSTTQTSPSGTAAQVELATLLQDPSQYDEQKVTTSGVADQLTPFVLALTAPGASTGTTSASASILPSAPLDTSPGDASPTTSAAGSAGGEANRLVVVYGRITAPSDGTMVTVTGTLQDSFDVAAIERTLGITLDDQVMQTLGLADEDVVLVADTVTPMDGTTTTSTTTAGSS